MSNELPEAMEKEKVETGSLDGQSYGATERRKTELQSIRDQSFRRK